MCLLGGSCLEYDLLLLILFFSNFKLVKVRTFYKFIVLNVSVKWILKRLTTISNIFLALWTFGESIRTFKCYLAVEYSSYLVDFTSIYRIHLYVIISRNLMANRVALCFIHIFICKSWKILWKFVWFIDNYGTKTVTVFFNIFH